MALSEEEVKRDEGMQQHAVPSISLPKGGGAIRGIGEKFDANPVTGTSSISVPIALSPGRMGFGPQLSLSYDSGSGNGPFGFGWSLSIPSIVRKTNKGLPRYQDAEESDVFILSGSEDLVPVLRDDGNRHEDTTSAPGYQIHRYRPRIEGLFARIERWTHLIDGDVHWRSISKDNILTLYGTDPSSRIADPDNPQRVFSWLICETRDDKGNAILYEYRAEDGAGVDLSQAHQRNRGERNDDRRKTNRYVQRIRYGNRTPLLDEAGERPLFLTDEQITGAGWMFEVIFDYDEGYVFNETIDDAQQTFAEASTTPTQDWSCRSDSFSSYRSGFEIRTCRLCQHVLMFHHFPDEAAVGNDFLVRSTDFTYSYEENPGDASTPIYAFLLSVSHSGYRRKNGAYLKKSLPPLEFEYSQAVIQNKVEAADAGSLENLPSGLGGGGYQWVDLHGEGIPGILTEQAGGWFYKRNTSPANVKDDDGAPHIEAQFAPVEQVTVKPNFALEGGARFMDLAGDGQPDLVVMGGPTPGLYEHDEGEGWQSFRPFSLQLTRDLSDPNLKFVDLDGDGHADILITEDEAFVWHTSQAEEGFGPAYRVLQELDEEKGPRLVFADGSQSIYLSDMSGDGLTDLVRIRSGEVCYWPNLGYGHFGAMVTMDRSPHFDSVEQFNPLRLRFADIDGSGTTDLVYLHRDGVRLYFNQSGNSWSEPQVLDIFPSLGNLIDIQVTDLLGNGTACLMWSSALPGDAGRQMRYANLIGDQKPHLLTGIVNNLGAETRVQYAPSTKFYLRDRSEGKPWITRLPFPVHVVERVETYDHISRSRFVTRYAYHHGYFDGEEREFRGFGMVEQWDTEEFATLNASSEFPTGDNIDSASHVPPVHTKSWFHTGVYLDREHISLQFEAEYYRDPGLTIPESQALLLTDTILPASLTPEEEREACRALKGMLLRQEVYADDALPGSSEEVIQRAKTPYTVKEQDFTIQVLQHRTDNRHAVFYAHPREIITYYDERNPADSRIQHVMTLEVDTFGNVLKAATIGYGRHSDVADATLPPEDREVQNLIHITYTENIFTKPVVDLADVYRAPLPAEKRTYEVRKPVQEKSSIGAPELYPFDDMLGYIQQASDGQHDVAYEDFQFDQAKQAAAEDPSESDRYFRRLIEEVRTLYRPNDCGSALNDPLALLPFQDLEWLALPGESYRLAFTPGLLDQVYVREGQPLILDPSAALGDQGGYVDLDGDGRWWIPTGRVFLSPDRDDTAAEEQSYARDHFFLPHRYRDPFDTQAEPTETIVTYDAYTLLLVETRDALDNVVTVETEDDTGTSATRIDYRVLQPYWLTDPNGNRTRAAFDALGQVVATAVMGKATEPDDLPKGDSLDGLEPDLMQSQLEALITQPREPGPDPSESEASQIVYDLLGNASTRIVYDLDRFQRTRAAHPDEREMWQPTFSASIVRETHTSDLPVDGLSKMQISFSYSDGFGREIQKKIQAEPGVAPARDGSGQIIVDEDNQPVMTDEEVNPRWVGSGWMVFNNKGKPVRRYEPFFTDTHRFEFDVRIGVSSVLFYDPANRVIATLHPDHTWEKVIFDPWRQEIWDASDTIMVTDPKTDEDVGGFFSRLQDSDYLPTWHSLRTDPANAGTANRRWPDPQDRAAEQSTAQKASIHAATPTIAHGDALGRTFLTIAHNKYKYSDAPPASLPVEEHNRTFTVLDIEGNPREVIDAKDRLVMRYDCDMLASRIHQASMEAGERWMLNDVAGKPLYAWDSRSHQFRFAYDALRRPTDSFLRKGEGDEMSVGQSIYGESRPNPEASNSRGRAVEIHDQAGVVASDLYDFKGNLLRSQRRLAQDYNSVLDWSAAVPLEPETYTSRMRYDAINRVRQMIAPHSDQAGAGINVLQSRYNEANLLEQVHAWLNQGAEPDGSLDPATADLEAVLDIDYNAKGQRTLIDYGNSVRTTYTHDPFTFRLVHLLTRRDNATFPGDCPEPPLAGWPGCQVQNLHYTYDSSGNITHIRDDAQQAVYFNNQRVDPSAEYTYDAIYQLIEATGREHLGQTSGTPNAPALHSYNDASRIRQPLPNDGSAMGRYLERYVYDVVGNFLEMQHRGSDPAHPGWTRTYAYNELSPFDPGMPTNRLSSTTIGGTTETYSTAGDGYDAHGSLLHMPQLQVMQWDFEDQLRMTQRQKINDEDTDGVQHHGERTWYIYDSSGQRIRKVTEGSTGQVKEERIYLGVFEIYRKNGGNPLVRETLHIMDDQQRIALVETRTQGSQPGVPRQIIRFQLSNHLGSSSLELDHQAQIITYEEYTPFGSTAYQAVRSQIETPNRYRYTGKERDEESGLYYHGARYYSPWLGRWTSADPIGIGDGLNLYRYCRNSPVNLNDPNGMDPPNDDNPPVRVKPLITNVTPTGVAGNVQFHNLLSSDRSVSGRLALSGEARSSFILDVPRLSLSTTGIADVSGIAAVDTDIGRGALRLQGGIVLGDLSGLNLAGRGEGTFRIPVPEEIRLSGLPGSLLSTLPQAEGEARFSGALAYGSFSLADFRARASLASGRFEGRLDATSVGDFGRLRVDAAGSVSPEGDVSLESARFRATVDVPGVNLEARGTGTATGEGSLAVRGSADLRLLGLPSLHAEGTGTVSTEEAEFSGRFYGPGPLYTSYITGSFDLSTQRGISARAGVFGLTYTPSISVTDPTPPSPGLRAVAGEPSNPWTPGGLTLGASYFQYSQGLFYHVSGGFMPDLSSQVLSNPRFGVTAQVHF